MRKIQYEVGDVIAYLPFGGGERIVVVTAREDDIKNGRPGFDGDVLDTGLSVWGYDSQITRFVMEGLRVGW